MSPKCVYSYISPVSTKMINYLEQSIEQFRTEIHHEAMIPGLTNLCCCSLSRVICVIKMVNYAYSVAGF